MFFLIIFLIEYVWQVTAQRKEFVSRRNIVATYWLSLDTTWRVLTLFKMSLTHPPELLEFPVSSHDHSNCQFFMEMGRGTMTGTGELGWDAAVTQNVHGAVIEVTPTKTSGRDQGRGHLRPTSKTARHFSLPGML